MRSVAIAGLGTTDYGAHGEGVKSLGIRAVAEALGSCDVERETVDGLFAGNFMSGILEGQETIAPLIADNVGLTGVDVMTTEGACASSGLAFRQAHQAIAAGVHDVVVVVGVESMTVADTATFTRALGSAADQRTEGSSGLTFAGFYGLFADRYLAEHDATHEDFAAVAVKNRANGVENPRAQFRERVTVDEVLSSKPIADPLRLYDCCPASDGATAVVLAAEDVAADLTDRPGWQDLTAVQNDCVYLLDGHHFVNRPGPRLVETAEHLAGLLYPDEFERPPEDVTVPLTKTAARE
mgnify:CR=1 FL=1